MGKTDKIIKLTEEIISTHQKHMSPQKKSKQNKNSKKKIKTIEHQQTDASLQIFPLFH